MSWDSDRTQFIDNYANDGGAIYASYSTVSWDGDSTMFVHNSELLRTNYSHKMEVEAEVEVEVQPTRLIPPCPGMAKTPSSSRTTQVMMKG